MHAMPFQLQTSPKFSPKTPKTTYTLSIKKSPGKMIIPTGGRGPKRALSYNNPEMRKSVSAVSAICRPAPIPSQSPAMKVIGTQRAGKSSQSPAKNRVADPRQSTSQSKPPVSEGITPATPAQKPFKTKAALKELSAVKIKQPEGNSTPAMMFRAPETSGSDTLM